MSDKRKYLGPAVIAVVLLAVAGGVVYYMAHARRLPDGLIAATGRIEGERIVAASKFAGKIASVMVHEGDNVVAGADIAQLDDVQIASRLEQARQALNALDAQLKAGESALAIARREVPLNQASADAGVSQAQAVLNKAGSVEAQAALDARRHRELFEHGSIEKHRAEQAELAWQVARNDVAAARETLVRARQGSSGAALGGDKIGAKEQELAALRAQRERAAAVVAEAMSVSADQLIKAPAAGVVVSRLREPGEVIQAGSAVAELANLDALHLKVYVPEALIGKVKLGLPVRLYIDSQPEQAYDAKVSYIAARAEFTPKEVQTADERVKLVYAVKLAIQANPQHRLTPGLPADAVIRWDQNVAWQKPTW
ncbi:HlyD family secretion protein [Rugamonas sp. CCM 8940]|uniref:HlyD family secretion protein n=1 Tax=Rugamonas sp. CCM 8940 TaxID=2765359 RepID=UPI0018F56FCE|nr:HlyD family efflux transporter periplasmic adaptor subunit [Rugamonas sp. CCM 8940]MBJ7312263.1 HlyD family efflux transporter periplasmic adaptor subunit [Rugamonas sp. CCM 8940]